MRAEEVLASDCTHALLTKTKLKEKLPRKVQRREGMFQLHYKITIVRNNRAKCSALLPAYFL